MAILALATPSRVDSLLRADDSLKGVNESGKRFVVYSLLAEEYEKAMDTASYIEANLQMADMSRAAGSHLVALHILEDLENSQFVLTPKQVIETCLIKGSTLYEVNDKDSAIYWGRNGLLLSKKFNIRQYDALLNNLLGACYMYSKPDSGIKYIEASLKRFLLLGDTNGAVLPYLNLGLMYGHKKQHKKSVETINSALKVLDKNDVPIYRKMAYANLAMVYRNTKDFKKSTYYLNLRDSVNFEINNNELNFQFSQFQAKLDEEKTARELLELKSKVQMQNLENRNQEILITSIFVLLLALGVGLFYAMKSSRLKNEKTIATAIKAEELEKINDFKNQILSVISHDMRSPLAQVITFQHAKNSGINFSPDEVREMDKTIMASAKNGLLILDNLLKWATNQFSSDEIKKETFDSFFVINQIIQQVKGLADEKEIEIYADIAAIDLYTNESLYQIILRNLLSNAIKFSPTHSEIRVDAREENGEFRVMIIDQGPGIPTQILNEIESGNRVKPKTGSFGEKGAGIGLTFSKDFARKIGAHLTFNKEILVGTEATFEIAIKKEIVSE